MYPNSGKFRFQIFQNIIFDYIHFVRTHVLAFVINSGIISTEFWARQFVFWLKKAAKTSPTNLCVFAYVLFQMPFIF